MCKDPDDGPPRRRIAVCACNAFFPDCDLSDALSHITAYSSTAHRWVYLAEDVRPMFNGGMHGD